MQSTIERHHDRDMPGNLMSDNAGVTVPLAIKLGYAS
jgi:hypothetical protein